MKKFFSHSLIFILLFAVTFVSAGFIFSNDSQYVYAQNCTGGKIPNGAGGCKCPEGQTNNSAGSCQEAPPAPATGIAGASTGKTANYDENEGFWVKNVIRPAMAAVSFAILKFMSFLLGISGVLLNQVLHETVVQMADNLESGGLGDAINSSWTTVRDVANMSFIFVLLFMSIQLILGLKGTNDVRNLIVKIIIAALLINFSLFATKVVIDAANVVALTFYEAISPGATKTAASATNLFQTGLSNSLMNPLRLSSLMEISRSSVVSTGGIITIGIMGSLMLLVATFIFLVISVLFVIRYVVLIFVLILSPLALIADIVPGIKDYFNQWKKALINQAFFPAIYFFLTWITIKLLRGITAGMTDRTGPALSKAISPDVAGTINYSMGVGSVMFTFSLVIAFLIASLVISKKMASQGAPMVDGMVKWASGAAGAATFGMAGRFGRGTIGRAGQAIADNKILQQKALEGNMAARLTLAASKKTGGASFDARAGVIGKQLGAGNAQKGGYIKDKKNKEDERKELVKNITSTSGTREEGEKNRADRVHEEAKTALKNKQEEVREDAENTIGEIRQARTVYEQTRQAAENTPYGSTERQAFGVAKANLERLRKDYKDRIGIEINARTAAEIHAEEDAKENSEKAKKALDEIKRQRGEMVEAAAVKRDTQIENATTGWKGLRRFMPSHRRVLLWGKIKKEDEQASSIIRQQNKEKPLKDKIFEDLKKAQKEEAESEAAAAQGATSPPPTPSNPPAGGTPPAATP